MKLADANVVHSHLINSYVWFGTFGDPLDVLQVGEKAVEGPRPGEILVRMLERPVNPSDLIPVTGAYAHRISLPAIAGYEGVGIVEEAGAGVSRSLIGQRVLPLRGEGTWQRWVRSPARWAVPVPPGISNSAAAQLYINPLTALILCKEQLELQEGQVLAVNACGSAIGRLLIQLAKQAGADTVAIVRNREHERELYALGAAHVIDSSQVPVREALLEATDGRGADAAVDSIGGIEGTELACSVRAEGTFVTIGLLSGQPLDWRRIGRGKPISARMFHLRHWNRSAAETAWHESFAQICRGVQDGTLTLLPAAERIELDHIVRAVQLLQAGKRNQGKIILV